MDLSKTSPIAKEGENMPTSLLTADTLFPQLGNEQTSEEKIDKLTNYLYMLLEQLRYSLANVGRENFNDTEFDGIADMITAPVYMQMQNEDASIKTMINITAEGFTSQINAVSGNVSTLTQTVNGIATKVSSAEGNISSLTQTVSGIETRVKSAEGNISTLTQTANGLMSKVESAEGKITTLQQTVNGLELSVTNGESSSTLKLSANGTEIDSAEIKITGMVTFANLYNAGQTIINGGNIRTGTISGITYYARGVGESFVVQDTYGYRDIGGIRYDYVPSDGSRADKMYLYTTSYFDGYNFYEPSIKLESVGNISIEAPYGAIYILGPEYVSVNAGIINLSVGNTYWQFADGALYKNGTQVL